jgi:hypothetical protein
MKLKEREAGSIESIAVSKGEQKAWSFETGGQIYSPRTIVK